MKDTCKCNSCTIITSNFKIETEVTEETINFTKEDYGNRFRNREYRWEFPKYFITNYNYEYETKKGWFFNKSMTVEYKTINVGTITLKEITKYIICGLCNNKHKIHSEREVISSDLKPLKFKY